MSDPIFRRDSNMRRPLFTGSREVARFATAKEALDFIEIATEPLDICLAEDNGLPFVVFRWKQEDAA